MGDKAEIQMFTEPGLYRDGIFITSENKSAGIGYFFINNREEYFKQWPAKESGKKTEVRKFTESGIYNDGIFQTAFPSALINEGDVYIGDITDYDIQFPPVAVKPVKVRKYDGKGWYIDGTKCPGLTEPDESQNAAWIVFQEDYDRTWPPPKLSPKAQLGKPPLGLEPNWAWKEKRVKDLEEAIQRRFSSFHPIPSEWLTERNDLVKELIERHPSE